MAVLDLRFCARAFSSCGKREPLFVAVRGPLAIAASLVAEHRLQTRRLSSCGSWAQLLGGMWDLPRPGLKPMSPALAGRLSTAAPPGKPQHYILLKNLFHLFIFGCVGSSLPRGLSQVAASGGYSSLWCAGFSLRWILLLRSTGSRCTGFSSCGTWAQQLWCTGLVFRGMWDLPRPGIEPVSPALAGGFLTTAPPGKSQFTLYSKPLIPTTLSLLVNPSGLYFLSFPVQTLQSVIIIISL